ncbi:hypothetical protein K493DRAFT_21255 [Basidiobolus meristosporus CBS 931.73]|uniref:BZIP domain-containing protein n=1 Tax=Basidiobolus meristosporus CBS 931.73 TaxID=1314790 RepID=A0A1Y1YEY5_9FUNG|nr:hypothetical protein K493DRAFT_21255 [Basidiobolus meristosporus CBS 931.73]|eukprot:ORX96144.1 hypothetical protein K493DRAFT_21255 [Basidiobolus meristosporus CBS 931.73]
MTDTTLNSNFVEGEVCDAFDAFIDPKYVEESENLTNSELFRYYFESELPHQIAESLSSSDNIVTTSPSPNIKMEESDIELVLQTLLNSVNSHIPATTEPALLCGDSAAASSPSSPHPSPDHLQHSSKKPLAKSPTRQLRASSLEADLDPNNPEIQKLSSKERRQLRNKISARNFRVRRKEYISTLEAQVQQYQSEIKTLRDSLSTVEDENSKLRSELAEMRSSFDAHVPISDPISNPSSLAESAVEPMIIESPSLRRSASPFTFTVKSGMAPISNGEHFNKDIPNSATSPASLWQDSRVIVH